MTYTTIASDNDAVQLSAELRNGKYYDPYITFYSISQDWRTIDDKITELWDNSPYLLDELYISLVKVCKNDMSGKDCEELLVALNCAKVSYEELKNMMTSSIEIGFFENVECEFFN